MFSQHPSAPPLLVRLRNLSISNYFSYSNVNVSLVFSFAVSYQFVFTSYASHTIQNSCVKSAMVSEI